MTNRKEPLAGGPHPSKWIGLAIGGFYAVFGLIGFLVTGFEGFASPEGEHLGPFELNPLQNLLHLAIGLTGLALWPRLQGYRLWGWLIAIPLLALALYGYATEGRPDLDYLALNPADHALHLFTGIAAVMVALWPKRYLKRVGRPRRGPGRERAAASRPSDE